MAEAASAILAGRSAPPLEHFLSLARIRGVKVETGEFGATMEVDLVNDGPVTIMLDSRENVKNN